MLRTIAFVLGTSGAVLVLTTAVRAGDHDREHGEEHEHPREHHGRRDAGERGDDSGRSRGERSAALPARIHPAYAKECGACHVPFPPNLMPARSWRRVMAGLEHHFGGQNAELEPEVRADVEGWLVAHAGQDQGAAPLRVTEGAWFRRKHRKVLDVAARPPVRSPANCAACHPGAERWDFEEDRVKIPGG